MRIKYKENSLQSRCDVTISFLIFGDVTVLFFPEFKFVLEWRIFLLVKRWLQLASVAATCCCGRGGNHIKRLQRRLGFSKVV